VDEGIWNFVEEKSDLCFNRSLFWGWKFIFTYFKNESMTFDFSVHHFESLYMYDRPRFDYFIMPLSRHDRTLGEQRPMAQLHMKRVPAVGGITIYSHFELALFPLDIQMTKPMYQLMYAYFFPGSSDDAGSEPQLERLPSTPAPISRDEMAPASAGAPNSEMMPPRTSSKEGGGHSRKKSVQVPLTPVNNPSRPGVATPGPGHPSMEDDPSTLTAHKSGRKKLKLNDLETMRMRALSNNQYNLVKINEMQVRISYHEYDHLTQKSVMDFDKFVLVFRPFVYNNVVCSWKDLFGKVRKDVLRELLPKAGAFLKHKLTDGKEKTGAGVSDGFEEDQNSMKARFLLGEQVDTRGRSNMLLGGDNIVASHSQAALPNEVAASLSSVVSEEGEMSADLFYSLRSDSATNSNS
jgi:hypothetical protein